MRLLAKVSFGCFLLAALGLVYGGANVGVAQDKGKDKKKAELKVKVGDTAPTFESVDEDGKTFKSSDVVGKKILVLYFYPADFTGGCTSQACAYRDDIEKLGSKGVMVVGVSGDSVSTHKLFKAYHKLPFTLLADGKGELAKLFGVPVAVGEKTLKGAGVNEKGQKIDVTRTASISRYTVVIDKAGKVAAIDEISKDNGLTAGGDAKRIAELVNKLAAK